MSDEKKRVTLEEMERKIAEIGRIIGGEMPRGCGFALLLFNFSNEGEDGGFMNWVSNAQRPDMIKALKEMVHKLENDRRDFHRTERKS